MYMFCPNLAKKLESIEKAFIINFIALKTMTASSAPFTYEAWHEVLPWVSQRTLRRYLTDLRDLGYLTAKRLSTDPADATLFYTVNPAKVSGIGCQISSQTMCPICPYEAQLDVSKIASKKNEGYLMLNHVVTDVVNLSPSRARVNSLSSSIGISSLTSKERDINSYKKEREGGGMGGPLEKMGYQKPSEEPMQNPAPTTEIKPEVSPVPDVAPPVDKKAPPVVQNTLEQDWYGWAREKSRAVRFSLKEVSAGLSEIKSAYELDEEKILAVFEHVKGSGFFSQRLLSPREWSKKCGKTNMIEAVLMEIEAKRKKSASQAVTKNEKDLTFEEFASRNF